MIMSVMLAAPAAAAWTPTTGERTAAAAIVATRATTFLRSQTQWLQRGLEHADDSVALDIVLAAHDRAHERWVGQIRAVEQALGDVATQNINAAYSYLGRVAGSLDAGTMRLLPCEIATVARQLLAERLADITEQAVEALWDAAAQV
jgi:hypothetical protein